MKPIYFRNQNYDPQMVVRLAGQGHREDVATADIITLAASKSIEQRIGVRVEGKVHLLTGSIDPNVEKNQMHVISTVVLKKAAVQPQTYGDRQHTARVQQAHDRSSGFNDYGRWR